ncbi:hypothetical protein O4H56_21800, partial [Pseudomonas anguilliseptica]|nr:hypothetical protein [Pseudomonas anguilliseptica]
IQNASGSRITGRINLNQCPEFVDHNTVKKKRKELGIAAYQAPFPEITPEIAAEFGRVSDSVLAKRLGVSASHIRRARLRWMGA